MKTVLPGLIANDVQLSVISPLYIQDSWNKFSQNVMAINTGEYLSTSTLSKSRNLLKKIFGFAVVNEILEISMMHYLDLKIPRDRFEISYEKREHKFLENE